MPPQHAASVPPARRAPALQRRPNGPASPAPHWRLPFTAPSASLPPTIMSSPIFNPNQLKVLSAVCDAVFQAHNEEEISKWVPASASSETRERVRILARTKFTDVSACLANTY
jgi:hypothetical protein